MSDEKIPGGKLLKYVWNGKVHEATMALLHGADPNSRHHLTGDTALHLAISIKNEVLARVLVKLLIVFDADLTVTNYDNKTALELAEQKGATAIANDIKTILRLQREEMLSDTPRDAQSDQQNPDDVFLLSLDGGGIRGLVFCQAMIEMEKRRKQRYPDAEPLLSKFNWLTGNSAGGISVLALAGPGVDAKCGRRLFFMLKNKVLGDGDPPIPNERVDGVFQDVYDKIYKKSSPVMTDIKDRKVSVMTTLCKQCPAQLHIMSNYNNGGIRQKCTKLPEQQLIWAAARATSAVPIIFHPQSEEYIDGGLIANNPTTDAIIDMFEYAKNAKKSINLKLVLSLGTGFNARKEIDDVDFAPSRFGELAAKVANFVGKHHVGVELDELCEVIKNFKAFINVKDIVLSQITQPNGQVLKRAEFVSEQAGAKYFRINPDIPDIDFLTTDDEKLIEMLYSVVKYMLENCRKEIDPVLDYVYGQK